MILPPPGATTVDTASGPELSAVPDDVAAAPSVAVELCDDDDADDSDNDDDEKAPAGERSVLESPVAVWREPSERDDEEEGRVSLSATGIRVVLGVIVDEGTGLAGVVAGGAVEVLSGVEERLGESVGGGVSDVVITFGGADVAEAGGGGSDIEDNCIAGAGGAACAILVVDVAGPSVELDVVVVVFCA